MINKANVFSKSFEKMGNLQKKIIRRYNQIKINKVNNLKSKQSKIKA